MYIGILVPQSRQAQNGAPYHADMPQQTMHRQQSRKGVLTMIQHFFGKLI